MVKPKLLFHVCCAPCSGLISRQLQEKFAVTVFYDNSNIYPRAEFECRAQEAENFFQKEGVAFILTDWENEAWLKLIEGLENEPERGKRCQLCYHLRLKNTAEFAKENDFAYFTTSLIISPYKDKQTIFNLGQALAYEYGVKFLGEDFSADNGYLKAVEFSKQNNFYRQKYCGCLFSDKNAIINKINIE
jgi:epoxyqueuosine reductase